MTVARATTSRQLVAVRALDRLVFPYDASLVTARAEWWLAYDGEVPVGYAGIKWVASQSLWYLCRVGVLPSYRGRGLAARLTRVRLALAKKRHPKAPIITYCAAWNLGSANNLIKAGFRLYTPETAWGIENALYWRLGR